MKKEVEKNEDLELITEAEKDSELLLNQAEQFGEVTEILSQFMKSNNINKIESDGVTITLESGK